MGIACVLSGEDVNALGGHVHIVARHHIARGLGVGVACGGIDITAQTANTAGYLGHRLVVVVGFLRMVAHEAFCIRNNNFTNGFVVAVVLVLCGVLRCNNVQIIGGIEVHIARRYRIATNDVDVACSRRERGMTTHR